MRPQFEVNYRTFSPHCDGYDHIVMQNMDENDGNEVGNAPRLIPNLSHRLLQVRCNAALGVGQRLISLAEASESDDGESKTASLPFRRLGRALVHAYVTGHYHEKPYSRTLLATLNTALKIKEVDMTAVLLETLVELKPVWKLSVDKASAVIELCIVIADMWLQVTTNTATTEGSKETGVMESKEGQSTVSSSVERLAAPGWLSMWMLLCGECLESMDCESHHASAWLRRSSCKLGEYLLSCSSSGGGRSRADKIRRRSPLQLMAVVQSWTEQGLVVALAGLFAYLSCALGDENSAMKHNQYTSFVTLKTNLISLVDKRLLNSKTPVVQSTLTHLGDLFFSRLTAVDWSSPAGTGGDESAGHSPGLSAAGASLSLEALVLRAMKKAPEGSAPVVAAVLGRLGLGPGQTADRPGLDSGRRVDLSGFIKEGAAVAVLRALKVIEWGLTV